MTINQEWLRLAKWRTWRKYEYVYATSCGQSADLVFTLPVDAQYVSLDTETPAAPGAAVDLRVRLDDHCIGTWMHNPAEWPGKADGWSPWWHAPSSGHCWIVSDPTCSNIPAGTVLAFAVRSAHPIDVYAHVKGAVWRA